MIIDLCDEVRFDLTAPPYDTEGFTCTLLGNKGSGKSNTMAVMAEEAHHSRLPFIYYDPNGDALSLAQLGDDIVTVGDPNHPDPIRRAHYPLDVALKERKEFINMVLQQGFSLVVDLTEGDLPDLPLNTFTALVNEHFRRAGRLRTPCLMLVDEAHMFAPQGSATKEEQTARRALGKVSTDGRKRGMLLVVATQRATYLDKKIIFGANVRIFGKTTYFPDFEAIRHYVPASFQQMQKLRSGQCYIKFGQGWGFVRVKRRRTEDLGRTPLIQHHHRERPSMADLQLPLPLGGDS